MVLEMHNEPEGEGSSRVQCVTVLVSSSSLCLMEGFELRGVITVEGLSDFFVVTVCLSATTTSPECR